MGENNCKWSNWQRINLQNTQVAQAGQCQENKQLSQNMGRRPKQVFLQKDIQMAKERLKIRSILLL